MSDDKKVCGEEHPMYDFLHCRRPEGHEFQHEADASNILSHRDVLRWGVPDVAAVYAASVRVK